MSAILEDVLNSGSGLVLLTMAKTDTRNFGLDCWSIALALKNKFESNKKANVARD